MTTNKKPARSRNIANDILDAVGTATSKWTRQKKSEERHPGNIRYRMSRMTKEPRTTQKDAVWEVMELLRRRKRRAAQVAGEGAANFLSSAPQDHETD